MPIEASIPPLTFKIDVSGMDALADISRAAVGAALEKATWKAAKWMQNSWAQTASDLGVHDTGAYLRGIGAEGEIRPVSSNTDDPEAMSFFVTLEVVNTCKYASVIEEGHGAFHLPDKVDWSRAKRVKMSKDGTPYIHVPFRHYTFAASGESTKTALRSMMPKDLTLEARGLDKRISENAGAQYTTSGQYVAADRYHWEDLKEKKRITRESRPGTAEQRGAREVAPGMTNPAWQSSKFEGMFKAGAADSNAHNKYLTIRTMTAKSAGWNIPAQAGKFVARQTAQMAEQSDEVKTLFEDNFRKALKL